MAECRKVYRHAYERKIEAEIARLGDTIRLWKCKAGESGHCPDQHFADRLDDVHGRHQTAPIMLRKMKRTVLDEWDDVRPEVQRRGSCSKPLLNSFLLYGGRWIRRKTVRAQKTAVIGHGEV